MILDTSVLISAERKRLDLAGLFAAHGTEEFFIAAITASELLHGVARADTSERKKQRSLFVESIITVIEVVDFDLAVARRHAELWAALEISGRLIGPYDLLIAATALHFDHAVVTLNTTEFRQVPDLRLIDTGSFQVT